MAANSQVLLGLYAAIYVRSPDQAGYKFWTDGFALPAPTTLTTRGAATAFSARTEWATAYPTTLSDTAYVDKIYLNVLGIAGDANGRKFWTDLITAKTVTRTDFVADFIAATLDYNSTTDTTSTAAEKTAALGAQATIQSKVTFSETWVANTAVSGNSTITGVDSTGGYIASLDKSVALLAGVTDAATLATQTPKIAAAGAAGTAFTLTTGTDTLTALTALNDTVTGATGTLGSDVIIDNTTSDVDVLTATGVAVGTKPTITKVETINISNSFSTGLDVSSVSGATTLNTAVDVSGGSATISNVKASAVATIVAGTNVGTLTVEAPTTGTGGDVAITTGSATTLNLKGGAGTDGFALTTTGNITVKATGTAGSIESLKLTANPAAVTGTAAPVTPVVTLDTATALLKASTDTATTLATDGATLTVLSTGAVQVKAGIGDLTGRTVTKGAGALTVTLDTPVSGATFYNLKGVIADTLNLNADFGSAAKIYVNDNSTIATPIAQSLVLANAALATVNNTSATQTLLKSDTIKSLTVNSAAPAITGVDATYDSLDLTVTTTSTATPPVTTTAYSATKVTFTGGTAAAGTTAAVSQDIKVTSGKVETVDASKLVGSVDYTHAFLVGSATVPATTDVAEKFNITGSAGDDKVAFSGTLANAKAAIVASLGDGNDTFTLPTTIFAAGSTINVDGGVGTADTLTLKGGADVSAATLTLAGVENIAFDSAGGAITLGAAQVSGQTYNIKGSAATTDNFTVKGVAATTSVDLTKLVFDSSVEMITINGAAATGGQTLSGIASLTLTVSNAITGGSGADTITGGAGADTLSGGTGVDSLKGGLGTDVFSFAAGDSLVTGVDTVSDFKIAESDKISVVGATFANISSTLVNGTASSGKAAIDPNSLATFSATDTTLALQVAAVNSTLSTSPAGTSVIWASGSDTIFFSRIGAAVDATKDVVVKITGVAPTKLADFVTGVTAVSTGPTTGNDVITGTSGNDDGTAGNGAILDGLAGNDTITGLGGNDTFNISLGTDVVNDLGLGSDQLVVSASATGVTATLAGAWAPTGATTANNLTAAASVIKTNGFNADLSITTGAAVNGWTITNAGSTAPVTITGSSGADIITGGDGADTFVYPTYASLFATNAAVDSITGGIGTDTISVTGGTAVNTALTIPVTDIWTRITGVEKIASAANTAAVSITLDVSAQTAGITTVDISKASNTTGNVINVGSYTTVGTTLIGSATGVTTFTGGSVNDTITGGTANDVVTGGKGADKINVGTGTDTVNLASGTTATGGDSGTFSVPTTNTISTTAFDVVTGMGVGDKIQLLTNYTGAAGAAAGLVANGTALATTLVSLPVADNTLSFVKGTYDATANTFVGSTTGVDSLLAYDSAATLTTGLAYEAIVLVGYVPATVTGIGGAAGLVTLA